MTTLDLVMQVYRKSQAQPLEYFVRQPIREVASPLRRMELRQEEMQYNSAKLQELVFGMIADYLELQKDRNHRTALLKNTTQPATMLLDGLQRHLSDYVHLRCVSITPDDVALVFKERLKEEEIHSVIAAAELPFTTEQRKHRGRHEARYLLDGKPVLGIQLGSVNIPYREAGEHLKESIALASGLVARIHQDHLFEGKGMRYDLDEYLPVFQALFPEAFSSQNVLTPFLLEVYDIMQQKEFLEQGMVPEGFFVSKASLREDKEKRYALKKDSLPDHLQYLVLSPEKQEIYLRFGCHMEAHKIRRFLQDKNYALGEEILRSWQRKGFIRKGGGSRLKIKNGKTAERQILAPDGQCILSMEQDSMLKLFTALPQERFAEGAELAGGIYHRRLFYTSWEATEQTDTDLTPDERTIIAAIDPLRQLQRFFIEPLDDRERIRMTLPVRNSLQWIADHLRESNAGSFPGKVLEVLTVMDQKIKQREDSRTFRIYGPEQETQHRAQELYGLLQQLKGRFETVVEVEKQQSK